MRIVMTMMVRDEADIIRAVLEHHRAQGIDQILVTDNASVDGTLEILQEYAADGFVDLAVEPRQLKQQSEVVTAMARRAAVEFGADWVVNADADEFWVAADRRRTVREVLSSTPTEFESFMVPVIDMIGAPAASGSGFDRLVYRDLRPVDRLEELGLFAHSTPDAIHVGRPDIIVGQGNHNVSIESKGAPATEQGLEVLHLPWRSWSQYARKVEQAGRAYESNPDVTPSPNHHGMRDYRRLRDGTLLGHYLVRHPDREEITNGAADGTLLLDDRLAALAQLGFRDSPLDAADAAAGLALAEPSLRLEARALRSERIARQLQSVVSAQSSELERLAAERDAQEQRVHALQARRSVRYIDRFAREFGRLRRRA